MLSRLLFPINKLAAFLSWYCFTYTSGPQVLTMYHRELEKTNNVKLRKYIKGEMTKIYLVGFTGTILLISIMYLMMKYDPSAKPVASGYSVG